MILIRKLLFPFAVLYGWITAIRNYFYNQGILKSYSFKVPTIVVGNLSVGGTGKTPQTEYLINLLSKNYKVAVLSRGYKRKSKGFILADSSVTPEIIGDEPYQIFQKFPQITLAVDGDRKNGIENLLKQVQPDVILLDDAFQHRRVKAGFYILLTAYNDLYSDDFMLPTGNLRESRVGSRRANIIIVTKCPENLSNTEQQTIQQKLNCSQPVYFTTIGYGDKVLNGEIEWATAALKSIDKVLLAGIAKPKPFFEYLQSGHDVELKFNDHHHFSPSEIKQIQKIANNKPIITTEKDYVRIKQYAIEKLFYLPVQSQFLSKGDDFDKQIINYVRTSSRNS